MVTGILAWLCFIALTNRVAMPWLDPQISSRPIARHILRNPEIAGSLKVFQVRRDREYALDFYIRRELKEWSPSELQNQYVVSSPNGISELRKRGIPYELVDDICIDAILVRVRPPAIGHQDYVTSMVIERGSVNDGGSILTALHSP